MPSEISLVRDIENKEIRVLTDEGRIMRPLYVVENNKLKVTKEQIELIRKGVISF